MMTEIRVNYEKAINQMIVQGTSRQALFAFINDMVDGYGRAGGSLAFNILNDALDNDLPEEAEEAVVDALEALSGQCNRKCWIGSGDYHLTPKAA
ncbi:hypothetical protein [Pseudescherichia sp.]|uniref:hypothetical protein n=1 Tax=Pseudescherichia sp. TaxID=2055881 RepID=UPI0028A0ABCB|nr:hypothetical protein [Pseudescherichia sp.]